MLRAANVRILCLGVLCAAVSVASAQDFSAEVFNLNGKDAAKAGKVYVKGSKMRIDRGDSSPEQAVPLLLVDFESQAVTILDATNHAYMKTEVGPEAGLTFFRVKDANNACSDLETMASMQSDCKKSGNESVNGRPTVKYTGKSEDGKPIEMWVDPEVNFLVKWQPKSGEIGELRNIKVGPQVDSLFDVPAGYHNAVKEDSKDDSKTDHNQEKGDTKAEPVAPPQ
jgi:hypothetical protein